jgi:DNA-binding NarL/FixJ family response regulator
MVEDDPLMLLGLEQFFKNYPQIRVIGQATDRYSAIAKATQLQPDLILMDWSAAVRWHCCDATD